MQKIPYARVDCSGNETQYVQEVLSSGWLTTASKALQLEKEVAELTGARFAIAVNSCTSALHLALEAIGVSSGDKVLVPTWTFTASAEVLRYLGADPVLLDVDYGTSSLTPEIVRDALIKNIGIKAIIVVHFGGQPAPMMSTADRIGIVEICKKHNVRIVEDAAHAFPARDQDHMIGNVGDVTCLSFYANKTMTTGEGGMLLTNDEILASRAKLMRLHGINRDAWDRFTSNKVSWEYDILAPGFKYNLPDLNAAVGLAQLERIQEFRQARQDCASFYFEELNDLDQIDLPVIDVDFSYHAWHIFPIVLNSNALIGRDELINKLALDGIGTSVHYKPLHRMTYYRDKYSLTPNDYPNAERLWKGCLSLPIYSLLSKKELAYITSRVKYHMNKHDF